MKVVELRLTCPKCGGDIGFECEPPDYEVGIMGWGCGMVMPEYRDCQCVFTEEEQEAQEMRASEACANGALY